MSILQAKCNVLHFYADIKKDKSASIFKIFTVNRDILVLNCEIPGPAGSIWEGGKFTLQLNFPKDFPAKPPEAKFLTFVYHPNVSQNGEISLDILNPSNWNQHVTLASILFSVQKLLDNPKTESPLNENANNAYQRYMNNNSDDEYLKKVTECIHSSEGNNNSSNSFRFNFGSLTTGPNSSFSFGSGSNSNNSTKNNCFDFSLGNSTNTKPNFNFDFTLPNPPPTFNFPTLPAVNDNQNNKLSIPVFPADLLKTNSNDSNNKGLNFDLNFGGSSSTNNYGFNFGNFHLPTNNPNGSKFNFGTGIEFHSSNANKF